MGIIFAPDHLAIACELARVCRPGGRIGFSAWREAGGFTPVTSRYAPPLEQGQGDSTDWGREEYVRSRLGQAFELEFEEGDAPVTGSSGEQGWQLLVEASGPVRARWAALSPGRREEIHRGVVD